MYLPRCCTNSYIGVLPFRRIGKEKAAQDLSEAETKRAALEAERLALRSEADQARALAQTIAREKAIVENSRRIVTEEAKALETRRAALEDVEGIGRRELDAGKAELKIAAEGLEKEKEALKAARKVLNKKAFPFRVVYVEGHLAWSGAPIQLGYLVGPDRVRVRVRVRLP